MEKYFFLPYRSKWFGFPLAALSLLSIIWLEVGSELNSAVRIGGITIPEELVFALLLLALLVIFFSKEKSNNQSMAQLKAEAMVVAVGINYFILMIGLLLNYHSWNMLELLLYNICSLFLFWLLIFYLKKRNHKKRLSE